MSKMMLKMLADMAGITPEEITASVEHFRTVAIEGVGLLERIEASLTRIETHLGTLPPPAAITLEAPQLEGQENGT